MGVQIIKGEGAVLGVNFGHAIITSWILCMRGGDALFSNDFKKDLFLLVHPVHENQSDLAPNNRDYLVATIAPVNLMPVERESAASVVCEAAFSAHATI